MISCIYPTGKIFFSSWINIFSQLEKNIWSTGEKQLRFYLTLFNKENYPKTCISQKKVVPLQRIQIVIRHVQFTHKFSFYGT